MCVRGMLRAVCAATVFFGLLALPVGRASAASSPPVIDIVSPMDGDTVIQGSAISAEFACADDVSIAVCTGSVASGERLDTATLGTQSLAVVARDGDGNETHRSASITIVPGPNPNPTKIVTLPVESTTTSPLGGQGLFGWSVAEGGGFLVVGAPNETHNGVTSGAAYVYSTATTPPTLVATLLPSVAENGMRFGSAVAASGGRIFVGAPRSRVGPCGAGDGSVFAYEQLNGIWLQAASVQPAAGAYYCGNSWGSRLSAANGLLVVGGNYGTRTYAVASDLTSEVAPMLYAFPGDSSMWFGPEVRLSPSANWLAKYDNRGGLDILRLGSNGWTVANRLTPPANSSIGMWQNLPVDLDDSGLVVSFYGLTLPNGRTDTSAFVIDLDGAAQVTSWRLWRLSESGLYGPGGAQLPTYSSLGAVLLDGREPGSGARTWS